MSETEMETLMRAQRDDPEEISTRELSPAFRGESYGTNQLLMTWQEKEVGPT